MILGKRGFALLPVLIILASVLVGTGSVLVLRNSSTPSPFGDSPSTEGEKNANENIDSSSPQMRGGLPAGRQVSEEQSDEAEGLNENDDANVKLQISNDESNSNSNNNLSTLNFQLSTTDSIYLEGDNDGKDELNLGKTLKIKGGEGIKTSLDNNTITITNTTYTAGDGLDLTGTEFSTDLLSTGGLSITSTELGIKLNGSTLNLSADGLKITDTYDDNFLTTSSTFSGDISGAYNSTVVADDSHSHTFSTLPSHDSLTGAGTIDTALEVQGISVGGDASGTVGTIAITNDSHDHTTTTISGLDISADTNLAGDTEIVLTSGTPNDSLSIADTLTRDTEWNTVAKIETATTNNILTNGENVSLLNNDSGFITASSSSALTNKTGNISQWTNDSTYITDGNTNWNNEYDLITLTNLSSSATGLTYTNTTGAFSLTSGYVIPTTTQETNWGTAYSNTHSQNTDSGTTSSTFQLDNDATGPKLKNNTLTLEVKNAADDDYANLKVKDLDIEGIFQAGSSNVQLTDTTGKIQALSSTYFASLSGSNLTSLNASNISSGTIPSATLSGSYTGITGVGTITAGTWSATEIAVTKGGTGLTTIAADKLLYSSALNTLSELSLDTTLEINAGILGVKESNILLSLLGGTLDDSQLPSGGDWILTTNLNIDANTFYVDQSTNRIGIGTTNPQAELDVNGTVKTENALFTSETTAPSQEEGKVYYDANDKQFKLYNSQNDGYTDLAQDPHLAPSYCPDGYVPVPGDIRYGTNEGFCVAKYEMKCALNASPTVGLTTPDTGYHTYSNSGTACTTDRAPKSLASGYPIVNITQTTAETYCSSLGTGYHLITNNEWMTMARNIEKTASNWTDGAVGSGGIWRGHTDGSGNTAFEASTDDTDPYYQTGNTAPSIEKRTFTLSNGENVWDLSGNVWEWNRDTIRRKHEPHSSSASNTWNWYELTSLDNYGKLSYANTRPSKSTWNATQNMGRIYTYSPSADTDETVYAFVRGGNWGSTSNAGLFTLYLVLVPGVTNGGIGFRCAFLR